MAAGGSNKRRQEQLTKCANLLLPLALHGFDESAWSWGDLFCYALRKPERNYYELFVSAPPVEFHKFLTTPPSTPELFDLSGFDDFADDIGARVSQHQLDISNKMLVLEIEAIRSEVRCQVVWFFSVVEQAHWQFLCAEPFDEVGVVECAQEEAGYECAILADNQPYSLEALLNYMRDTGRASPLESKEAALVSADQAVFCTPASLLGLLALLGFSVRDVDSLHGMETGKLWEGVNWALRRYASKLPSEPPEWLRNILKPFTPPSILD